MGLPTLLALERVGTFCYGNVHRHLDDCDDGRCLFSLFLLGLTDAVESFDVDSSGSPEEPRSEAYLAVFCRLPWS